MLHGVSYGDHFNSMNAQMARCRVTVDNLRSFAIKNETESVWTALELCIELPGTPELRERLISSFDRREVVVHFEAILRISNREPKTLLIMTERRGFGVADGFAVRDSVHQRDYVRIIHWSNPIASICMS